MAEIALLVVIAVIFFGPEKLPELARKAARIIAYLRRVGNDARGQLRRELGPEFDDLKLSDLNPKNFVRRHLLSEEEVADLRSIRDEAVEAGALVREPLGPVPDGRRPQAPAAADAAAGGTPPAPVPRVVAFDPEAT